MKKVLTLLLALALVVCMIPASAVTAFATETPVVLSADMITITGVPANYTGAVWTPTVTVAKDSVTYTKDTDYTVSWKKGESECSTFKDAGTYTVTITAKTTEAQSGGSGDENTNAATNSTAKLSGSATKTVTVAAANLQGSGVTIVRKANTSFDTSTVVDV